MTADPARRSRSRPPRPGQRLLTGPQVEAEYGVPYRSLVDMAHRGILPFVRFDGSRRLWFERVALEQVIARSRAQV